MENLLKIGDVVCLKSDSLKQMTIEGINGNEAFCIWFFQNKKQGDNFLLDTLTRKDYRMLIGGKPKRNNHW